MADEFPLFFWQHEYNNRWINFSEEENQCLNNAAARHQKTVTLPTNNPAKKKAVVNLEKMMQQNVVSGYAQRVRCAVCNNKFYIWCWQDNFGDFSSFTPRVIFFLEIAFTKKLQKVKYIDRKEEFEVNFVKKELINLTKKHFCAITREEVNYVFPEADSLKYLKRLIQSEDTILKLSRESEANIKNVLFGLPATVGTEEYDEPSTSQGIITALISELPASTSSASNVSVDPECPIAENAYVYYENSIVYHAPLNFSDLRENNNKFFIIQLLKYINKEKYAVWFHWGRVGYKGQSKLNNCGTNLNEAKEIFEKKFYDKTYNHWAGKNNFQKVPKKYDLLQIDFSKQSSVQTSTRPVPVAECKLESSIQDLLKIICDKKVLEASATDMEFDSSVTPLGKITASQILEGYNAINEITDILKNEGIGTTLIEACNKFYTKIPHNFGKKKPPLITSMTVVKEKLKMLEVLSNICLALDVISPPIAGENAMDKYYRKLECNLIPVAQDSEEFKELCMCLTETQGPTHNTYSMQIVSAFKCTKEEESVNFKDFGNNKLLWHGSRISNWLGILKKGLQIAPAEAPSTGYMFGKGIYFADVFSKSANYCFPTRKNPEGLLLLCEVSLGNTKITYEAKDFSKSLGDCHSVFAIGKHQSNFKNSVLSSEALFPCGPLYENDFEDLSLKYNEYVVYNRQQVKMMYLLRIRFHF